MSAVLSSLLKPHSLTWTVKWDDLTGQPNLVIIPKLEEYDDDHLLEIHYPVGSILGEDAQKKDYTKFMWRLRSRVPKFASQRNQQRIPRDEIEPEYKALLIRDSLPGQIMYYRVWKKFHRLAAHQMPNLASLNTVDHWLEEIRKLPQQPLGTEDLWTEFKSDSHFLALRSRKIIQANRGIVNTKFFLCPSLPLVELQQVIEDASNSGYRPVEIRPFSTTEGVRVATLWYHDGKEFEVLTGGTRRELELHHKIAKERGLEMIDLSSLEAPQLQFWAVWELPETPTDSEYRISQPEDHHIHQLAFADGWQHTSQTFSAGKSTTYFCTIWERALKFQLTEKLVVQGEEKFQQALQSNSFLAQTDGSVGTLKYKQEPSRVRYPKYCALWNEIEGVQSFSIHGLEPQYFQECIVQLMVKGFRPVSLSTVTSPGGTIHCSSVWHWPRPADQLELSAAEIQASFVGERSRFPREAVPTQVQAKISFPRDLKSDRLIRNSLSQSFVKIPAGEFSMGAVKNDKNAGEWEHPQHRVSITKSFYLSQYEVRSWEFAAIVGRHEPVPKHLKLDLRIMDLPAHGISWFDAIEFCNLLSKRERRTPYFHLSDIVRDSESRIASAEVTVDAGNGYRLPTEAEWEYACRAGSDNATWNHDSPEDAGWFKMNSDDQFHPVGMKRQNGWRLYDMHGNLWEHCLDANSQQLPKYFKYKDIKQADPFIFNGLPLRIARGGSYKHSPTQARSSARDCIYPANTRFEDFGFRIVSDIFD